MSGYLAGKVWRSNLPGTIKPLAACLADFANDDGDGVYPSASYLMWLLDWGETSVRQGMSSLKKIGVLEPVANETGGRGKIPVYRFVEACLPSRSPYKGSRNTTLSVKGSNSEPERVQILSQKGSNSGDANKEEPLVEPLVLNLTPPSSERKKKTTKTNIQELYEVIKTGFERRRRVLTWGKPEWSQLASLVKERPDLSDVGKFKTCLNNWSNSENVNLAARPMTWLRFLPNYEYGPLDRFHKPFIKTQAVATVDKVNAIYAD